MAIGSHKALLDQVAELTPEEQLHLLDGLTALVRQRELATPRSIMDLEGLGQEVWRDPETGALIGAQEYVNRERSSWRGYTVLKGWSSRSIPRRSSTL